MVLLRMFYLQLFLFTILWFLLTMIMAAYLQNDALKIVYSTHETRHFEF